jgi:eukaryotic-like serine/threonine-protein kinase
MSIDGYEILREITRDLGRTSYEARQKATGRRVALQLTLPDAGASPGRRDASRDALASLALLDHPHLVGVLAVGDYDGGCYLVRPLLSAVTLASFLGAAPAPPEPRQAARWVAQIADAVVHCHEHGIFGLHLSADDVLIEGGEARLNTFQVAHVNFLHPPLSPEKTLGVPFGCPEQIRGEGRPDDPRRDVWSLGVLLYRTLTGQMPFAADDVFETMLAVLEQEPTAPRLRRPEIPADLEAICLGCLRKKPEERPVAPSQVSAALRAFLEGRRIGPASEPAESLTSRMGRWVRGWWAPAKG